jgi:hypothetical protein
MHGRFASPRLLTLSLLTVVLTACGASKEIPFTATLTEPVKTIPSATSSPPPTASPAPTSTAIRTPPALPETYVSDFLDPFDKPHTYIADTCEYLKNRWNPDNAAPGTVVMIIMFGDINRGSKPNGTDGITVNQFGRLMENIQEQGFEAINSEQLADFLETNKYIPPRSVLLIQDGRRTADNFNSHFRSFWEESHWPVVNGWIVQADSPESLWQENLALEGEGFVDHQLYSPLSRYSVSASQAYLSGELKKYTDVFAEHFNKAPIAIIWPGKPGTNYPKAARQLGFRLGFTANTRGPVMYNWIPLADSEDLSRPAYYPEGPFDDPLMTLPRYWAPQAVESLDQVRLTGKIAAAYAEQNKEVELEYYDIVCAPTYGAINGAR